MSKNKQELATVNYRGQFYQVDARWLARRHIARKIIVYSLLIILAGFMITPLFYAFISSFRNNPLAWPPSVSAPRLWPPNWVAAWKLGIQGGKSGWSGGWAPGGQVELGVTFRYPESSGTPPLPRVQLLAPPYESGMPSPIPATKVNVVEVQKKPSHDGVEIAYHVILTHQGDKTYPVHPPRG